MDQVLKLRTKSAAPHSVWIALFVLILVWASYFFSPNSIIGALVGLCAGIFPLALGNRLTILYLAIFAFLSAETIIPGFAEGFGILRWLCLAMCLVIGLVRPLIKKQETFKISKEERRLWLFVIFALLSSFYSVDPKMTILRLIPLASTLLFLSRFLKPLAETYGVNKIIDLMLYALLPLLVASLFMLGSSSGYMNVFDNTYQGLASLTNPSLGTFLRIPRFRGVFTSPNVLGFLAALFIPLTLVRFLRERKKILYGFIMTGLAIGLARSASRGSEFACLVSGFYVLSRLYGARRIIKIFLLTMAVPGFILLPLLANLIHSDWFASYFRLGPNLLLGGGRLEGWAAALQIIQTKPLIGHGFGTEDELFYRFGYHLLAHAGSMAENAYIGLTMQVGLIGAFLFFFPILSLLFRELVSRNPSSLRIALQGMFLAALLGCLYESPIYAMGSSAAFPIWVCFGLLQYLRDEENRGIPSTNTS